MRRASPRLRASRLTRLALCAVVVVTLSACSSTRERIRERAVADLRDQAVQLAEYGGDLVGAGDSLSEAAERLELDQPPVFDARVTDATVTWDAVFYTKQSDGGGLWFEDIALRACARFVAFPAADENVTWDGVPCPEWMDLSTATHPYDETVDIAP